MKNKLFWAILGLFVLAACSPGATNTSAGQANNPAPTSVPPTTVPENTASSDPTPTAENVAYNGPDWTQAILENAQTGETFTLADFAGKTVFIEAMATWCPACRQAQDNMRAARNQIDSEDVVWISLSVETFLDNGELAQYADNAGYDWLFTVSSDALLGDLTEVFGGLVNNPPALPHFLIRPDGTVSELSGGLHSPERLIEQVNDAQRS